MAWPNRWEDLPAGLCFPILGEEWHGALMLSGSQDLQEGLCTGGQVEAAGLGIPLLRSLPPDLPGSLQR